MRKHLPETPAPWTGLGIALHETFCEWEKSEREIDVCEYFETYYDAYISDARLKQPDLDQWQIPPNSKDVEKAITSYRTRGLERDVPTYRDRCLEAEWEIFRFADGELALELPYEIELGGVVVKGYIDRIQWWPDRGYASLEDLKTGNLESWDRRQLGTYSYAAEHAYGIKIPYSRYWFTKTDQPSEWFDMKRYTKGYLDETYRKVDRIISERLFLANPGDHCKLCSVRPYCSELGWLTLP
jgi:CRISPR/Cas system-associated exonuclease Cas4 (RecB family)